jgi:hypothetical protein
VNSSVRALPNSIGHSPITAGQLAQRLGSRRMIDRYLLEQSDLVGDHLQHGLGRADRQPHVFPSGDHVPGADYPVEGLLVGHGGQRSTVCRAPKSGERTS